MNYKAIVRKPRRDPITNKCDKLFSKAFYEKDYKKAAMITLYNVLAVYGAKGMMNALDEANSFMERKRLRRGL